MKTTFPVAVLAAALACGAARAEEAKTPPSMRVVDVLMLGEGTVAGTVTRVGSRYFTLSDGQQSVDVTSKEYAFDGLKEGDRVTVTGTVSRGTFTPTSVVRADGTPLPKKDAK